jgi:hypothetical protein
MNMKRLIGLFCCVAAMSVAAVCFAQQPTTPTPTQLLDRLAGDWLLKGVLGGKETKHEVEAAWVLNREYLRLHEVSREKKANGDPAYEAIVFISWDAKAQEYRCLWLDNTEGGGLSVPTARAKREEHAIPFVFVFSGAELHTTFTYDKTSDTWNWTIDDVKDGKADRFADLTLSRRQ